MEQAGGAGLTVATFLLGRLRPARQVLDHAQVASATLRTKRRIMAGDPEKDRLPVLALCGL